MIFSTKFVSATKEKCTTKKNIPAPYMRRDIVLDKVPEKAEITVCGLGFYELFVKGMRKTRWERHENGEIELSLTLPDAVTGEVKVPIGYTVNGTSTAAAVSSTFVFKKC